MPEDDSAGENSTAPAYPVFRSRRYTLKAYVKTYLNDQCLNLSRLNCAAVEYSESRLRGGVEIPLN